MIYLEVDSGDVSKTNRAAVRISGRRMLDKWQRSLWQSNEHKYMLCLTAGDGRWSRVQDGGQGAQSH